MKLGSCPAVFSAPFSTGREASGAVSSSWTGKRLIGVLGMATCRCDGGRVPARLLHCISVGPDDGANKPWRRGIRTAAPPAALRRQEGDDDEQHAEGDG